MSENKNNIPKKVKMMEEIQKSIQLINFSDSVFDEVEEVGMLRGNENSGKWWFNNKKKDSSILLPEVLLENKYISYSELLRSYIISVEEEDEILKELLVSWSPFIKDFKEILRKESSHNESIEETCFGTALRLVKGKEIEILEYYDRFFELNYQIPEINVIIRKRIQSPRIISKKFNIKEFVKTFTLIEAEEYLKLDPKEFYFKTKSNLKFIEMFNRLTNYFISEILLSETVEERLLIVKKILKIGKGFEKLGAMNSLKSCMAALESNSIHRLHVIDDQGPKYKKRFTFLSNLTSPLNNFEAMRRKGCLIPWLGIILKDFTFIKEIKDVEGGVKMNIPLALCLRKLIISMTITRETCSKFLLINSDEQKRSEMAIMKKWINECEIIYESEEEQYKRSEEIKG